MNEFFLFVAATIWGISFVSQCASMEYIGPFTFSAIRCAMGTLVLIPVILIARKIALTHQGKSETLAQFERVFRQKHRDRRDLKRSIAFHCDQSPDHCT